MPATTIVAAWMSAETGVGPAMASGSQVCSTNWPDFDITAIVRQAAATTSAVWLTPPWRMFSLIVIVSKVMPLPAAKNSVIMPTRRPTSPTRLVMKAFSAASLLGFSSHQ